MSGPAEARTQTFMFADLAGFTALTEAHGDAQATELASQFFDWVRRLLSEYGAEEIKTIGDAVMLRCDTAGGAVELGLRIVDEVGGRPRFPVVRVGMHTGSAIERKGDWFGATVNLAARVSGLAGGDEVLLTGETREAAGELEGVEFRHHGRSTSGTSTRPPRSTGPPARARKGRGCRSTRFVAWPSIPGRPSAPWSSKASSTASARWTAFGPSPPPPGTTSPHVARSLRRPLLSQR